VTSTTRHLGVDLQSWSPDRLPLINAVDELVILQPMPSMPIGFWRDDDGSRYCAAYLSTNGPTAAHPGCGGTATGCVTAGSPPPRRLCVTATRLVGGHIQSASDSWVYVSEFLHRAFVARRDLPVLNGWSIRIGIDASTAGAPFSVSLVDFASQGRDARRRRRSGPKVQIDNQITAVTAGAAARHTTGTA
jgi:hypothetical protein